jgi:malonyl-CoA O-methyltransferase
LPCMNKMNHYPPTIEKDRVARSFLRGMPTYEDQAVVQKLVNLRLMELLVQMGRNHYGRILEIGSCTGMLSKLLYDTFSPELFLLNDLVPEFFKEVKSKLSADEGAAILPLFGDIEHLELPADLDLVSSSSTFQWLENLPRFFAKVQQSLSEGSVFAFSMFGDETYYEIKELTGAGLSYPSFANVRDKVAENFKIVHADIDRDRLYFNHPREVLDHIRATGVGGVGGFSWTPRRYEQFVDEYMDRFSTEQGVMLSYVSYLIIAQKRGE